MSMARTATILLALALGALPPLAPLRAAAVENEPVRTTSHRQCFPSAETREEIKSHHLLEPFAVLKSASAQSKAEALSAKLCRVGEEYVYEIALLHHDGRYRHIVVDAATGKLIEKNRGH